MRLLGWLLLASLLAACGDKNPHEMRLPRKGEMDWCGYTWEKKRPAVEAVFYHRAATDAEFPEGCLGAGYKVLGCFVPDKYGRPWGSIYIRDGLDQAAGDSGQCSTLMHEQMHAFGYDHTEDHRYVPRDYTR